MDLERVDFGPLTSSPSASLAAEVHARALAGDLGPETVDEVRSERTRAIVPIAVVGGTLAVILAITTIVEAAQEKGPEAVIGLEGIAVIALVCLAVYAFVRRVVQPRGWLRLVRFVAFADANGFIGRPVADPARTPGPLGRRTFRYRRVFRFLTWEQRGVQVETGEYVDSSTGTRSSVGMRLRYLAIPVRDALPTATFLCGRSMSNPSPRSFAWVNALGRGRVQLLCEKDDVREVRAFFTDELIAALTDKRRPAHAALEDGWFFAYFLPGGWEKPDMWRSVFRVAELVTRAG
ncbi:hypothetical protein GCM10009840_03560 [Pseudolysinimonas kribbensis]|uniref:hypothetical protein n=1 Tax=Pseudolysinimonas kribbensis TaxID=433641 RepID=UPI0031E075C1